MVLAGGAFSYERGTPVLRLRGLVIVLVGRKAPMAQTGELFGSVNRSARRHLIRPEPTTVVREHTKHVCSLSSLLAQALRKEIQIWKVL